MKAQLKWVTPKAELEIVEIARVSSKRTDKREEPENLIKYLINHKHWSPFEMANMCIDIECSVAVGRQILRHKSFSFQELSQRYIEVPGIEEVEYYMQDSGSNRQTSSVQVLESSFLREQIAEHITDSLVLYKNLLAAGVSRECARYVLPMATTTRMYMNGNVRSWIHFLQARLDKSHVQVEHYELAFRIKEIFKQQFPIISKALNL